MNRPNLDTRNNGGPEMCVVNSALISTGTERRRCHRGAQGVRARDGQGVPAGQEDGAEDQGPRHRAR